MRFDDRRDIIAVAHQGEGDWVGGLNPFARPNFLPVYAVLGEIWPNNRLAPPPLELAPSRQGNPGSPTVKDVLA